MPASIRRYQHTVRTLDLERYVAMYQRKPTTGGPIMPEPVAGMIVVIDGRLTNATPQEGGDDHVNPQRLWSFTVDDGSGGVKVIARKAQVLPLLTCMEAATPVYIVARLRFAHEVSDSCNMLSAMLGWLRLPDDLVCEVLRAGASEGLGVRADDTPEAQDEERERQHEEQMEAIATEGMADVPAPSARKTIEKLQREAQETTARVMKTYGHIVGQVGDIKTADQVAAEQYHELWNALSSDQRLTAGFNVTRHEQRVVCARNIVQLAISNMRQDDSPSAEIAKALQHATDAILLDARRLGLWVEVKFRYDANGLATIGTLTFWRNDTMLSEPMLVADAQRWMKGFVASQQATQK